MASPSAPGERPSEPAAPAPAAPPSWPVLNLQERRVLGVLVEKAKTTPDIYPLSINALVTGCNQKSNRDPLLNLSDVEVEDALANVQKKGLAIKITGGRVVKWRHSLYEAWHVDKVDLAILAELLLRGPQTEGELRSRASRMEALDDLDALRAVLRPLTERRLAVYLSPEGRRGTMVTHGFHAPEDLERLRAKYGGGAIEAEEPPPAPMRSPVEIPADMDAHLAETRKEMAALRQLVTDLHVAVADLAKQVADLKTQRNTTTP